MGRHELSTTEMIARFKGVHGDCYDYSRVNFIKATIKVEIICKEHGSFWQLAGNHSSGKGCSKCIGRDSSTTDFIAKAEKIHNYKYDYSKVDYITQKIPIIIICKDHGEFSQLPFVHLRGAGCKKCGILKRDHNREINHKPTVTTEEFIEQAKKVHNNKYDYSLAVSTKSRAKVKIICSIHGIFEKLRWKHLDGAGCPQCLKVSRGEKAIEDILTRKGVLFTKQQSFTDCRSIYPLRFDFYLLEHDYAIEFNGEQHYTPIDYWGGEDNLRGQIERDNIKRDYCKEEGIYLIEIPYWEKENIELILEKALKCNF